MIKILLALFLSLVWLPAEAASCDADSEFAAGQVAEFHLAEASPLHIQFESGAQWELCWHIDEHAGLVLSRVFYAAPAEPLRQVLDAASLGQILFKYDEDIDARHLLSDAGLGGDHLVIPDQSHCGNGELVSGVHGKRICRRFRQINHMTKVRHSESIRRHELSLHSWSRIGTHLFQQVWRLSEDGEITPSVVFSGTISRYTSDPVFGIKLDESNRYAASATLLYNWRLDFNINGTATNDRVDEIEFPAVVTDVVKHELRSRYLSTEAMRTTDREKFRGWRISDSEQSSGPDSGAAAATRIGYYLDPQSAGYRYSSQTHQWSGFDFSLTARHPCERFASANSKISEGCFHSLDDYVDEEDLEGTDIVVWFSISQHFTPRLEDFPAITAIEAGFKLVPFDWSAHSPFSSAPDVQSSSADLAGDR